MSKPFWLSELTPDQLKLLHDIADVIRATGLEGTQDPTSMAALINQEIEQRGNIQTGSKLSLIDEANKIRPDATTDTENPR
jgi:hypothetical protein